MNSSVKSFCEPTAPKQWLLSTHHQFVTMPFHQLIPFHRLFITLESLFAQLPSGVNFLHVLALCPLRPHLPHFTVFFDIFSAEEGIRFSRGRPHFFVFVGGFVPSSFKSFTSTGTKNPWYVLFKTPTQRSGMTSVFGWTQMDVAALHM